VGASEEEVIREILGLPKQGRMAIVAGISSWYIDLCDISSRNSRRLILVRFVIVPINTPLRSIIKAMHRCVCPLYSFDDAGKPYMVGSAVPFGMNRGSFLITATHVCFNHRRQPIPLFTWIDSDPLVLREFRIAWDHQAKKTPDVDVALLALSDDDSVKLKRTYLFSDLSSISTTMPKTRGIHYLIAGYPFIRNKITSTKLTPPALTTSLITGQIESIQQIKSKDKTDAHHFTLVFPLTPIRTLDGSKFRIPKPHGMSGGGIWRLNIDPTTHVASAPQLVGIGIEYHQTKEARVFLGTRVQVALSLAADLHHFMETSSLPAG